MLYQPGSLDTMTDCLSRDRVSTVTLSMDYNHLASFLSTSPNIQALRSATTGLRLVDVAPSLPAVLCDMSQANPGRWSPWSFAAKCLTPCTTFPIPVSTRPSA